MIRRILLPLVAALMVAGVADAQYGGGMGGMSGAGGMGGGMGGGAHRGNRQQQQQQQAEPEPAPDPNLSKPTSHMGALSKVQIMGVITGIDASRGQVTITYDEVEALNWPRGTTRFLLEKPELLTGLSVGEKVHFHVESQQISEIGPVAGP